jgi:hypothetical protein
MNPEEAARIYEDVRAAVQGDGGPGALGELYRAFLLSAVRYARMRTDWGLAPREERVRMDGARSRAHDAWIDACNILSRACAAAGRSNEWRRELGDERKRIGDFACHLHAILGIAAR